MVLKRIKCAFTLWQDPTPAKSTETSAKAALSIMNVKVYNRTVEKQFKCDICEKKFSRKQSLVQHVHSHTNEVPLKCDACGAQFAQKGCLKTHTYPYWGETLQM